jgi:PKD repeat protein
VQFYDSSINATGWSWTFGDGVVSTEQNPVHTFLKTGNYNVTLTAKNDNGSSTANTTILAKLLPTADFKANVTKGNAPLYVQFSDLSLNVESRSWDFTSDGTVDSSDLNPAYTYSTSGTYNVTLTVSNANGTASKNTTITVVQATSTTTSASSSSGGSGGSSGTTKTTSTSKSKSKSSGTSTQSVSLTQNSINNSTNLTNKTNATNATNVSQNTTDSKKSSGFEMFFGTVSLLAVFLFRRWKSV